MTDHESSGNGFTHPPVEELIERTGGPLSSFALAITLAKRARQIDAYYSEQGEIPADYFGPTIDTLVNEKSLTTAARELAEGHLKVTHPKPEEHATDQS